jgi:ferrous iron transport protein B
MSVAASPKTITVALIGNPNTGKSTLFSALAGVRQRVGNYPGVTVEKKLGTTEFHGQAFTIVDLPGTYSLSPRSPDEMVAVDVLLGRQSDVPPIDVVLCIVDASNLERNFYLVSQALELGLPTVVALNMIDVARDKGFVLDLNKLAERLPIKFVPVQANRGIGIEELKQAIAAAASAPLREVRRVASPFPPAFQDEVRTLAAKVNSGGGPTVPNYLVERMLLDTSGYLLKAGLPGIDTRLVDDIEAARGRLAAAGLPVPAVESIARYGWATKMLEGVITRPATRRVTTSDRIDHFLTDRVWGSLAFVAVMLVMFQAVFFVAGPASAAIDWLNGSLAEALTRIMPDGMLRSMLTTGVIGGVGGVLVFLPQIFTLFFFIAVLEDCGYMARAAYLMDKLMSRIGLSGKSFIPLLSSFACAVPGIMATRVIENRRDRLVTILVAPLMSCSARLPVYTLLIGAFVPNFTIGVGPVAIPWLQGLVMLAMYSVGTIAGIAAAFILKRTILRGPTPPFVMELPSYKMPGLKIVVMRMLEQGWSFVYRAGTLIFAVSIVVWGLCYFPHDPGKIDQRLLERRVELVTQGNREQGTGDREEDLAAVENDIAGQYLANSYLGRMGKSIEWAVRPLGWDWRIGSAAIASFPAREVVVATMGVIYNLGEGQDEASADLHERLRTATWDGTDRRVFNLPVALSIMVFFALCAQCASTLAVIRRETGTWLWPAFTFVYMTALAYVGALITYQVGIRLVS